MTGLTPIMADWSVWAVYANRIIVGLAGVCFSRLHSTKNAFLSLSLNKTMFVSLGHILSCNAQYYIKMGTAR